MTYQCLFPITLQQIPSDCLSISLFRILVCNVSLKERLDACEINIDEFMQPARLGFGIDGQVHSQAKL